MQVEFSTTGNNQDVAVAGLSDLIRCIGEFLTGFEAFPNRKRINSLLGMKQFLIGFLNFLIGNESKPYWI
jgi:hypothetical protein